MKTTPKPIKLKINLNEKLDIKVPISLMKDVVQPYYEESVVIQGYKQNETLYLDEIDSDSNDE